MSNNVTTPHKLIQNNPRSILFLTFFLVLFLKSAIFINYVDHFPINFIRAWKLYGIYIGVSGLIASFVFLFRWKWWVVIFSVVFDVWLVANLIYWRSFNDFLNVWLLDVAGNLKDYWTSIFIFMEWKDIVFPILTIVLVCLIYLIMEQKTKAKWISFAFVFILSFVVTIPQVNTISNIAGRSKNPLHSQYAEFSWIDNLFYNKYFSPISYFMLQIKTLVSVQGEGTPKLHAKELAPFIAPFPIQEKDFKSNYNLLLIIIESLESWIINSSFEEQEFTPNINKLVAKKGFIADKVTNQVRSGMSSDGLITINTGLLPIYKGITSVRHNRTTYFSLANALRNNVSSTYIVDDGKVWNQNELIESLYYDTLSTNNKSDYKMCRLISHSIPDKPYFLQAITLASHTPFTSFKDSSNLALPNDMPTDMANYIKSVNYTDNALGLLFDKTLNDNTIIVITGDHTIFHNEKREIFKDYVHNRKLDIPIEKDFMPLIVYSPEFTETILNIDTVYQMDIYPTILHVLNRDDYIWKGFGINLLDSTAIRNISPEEANRLSDAIIRNNYFKSMIPVNSK